MCDGPSSGESQSDHSRIECPQKPRTPTAWRNVARAFPPRLSDDVSHVIARNSESNLSTDGSAFRPYFGATEA